MKSFSIRVYGILINERDEVLLSDETYKNHSFTKFPGGGLEYGEGTTDCLKREFLEEFSISIEVNSLFYLTDFFQASAFHESTQIVSIYYQISVPTSILDQHMLEDLSKEKLKWVPLSALTTDDVTFPIDKYVVELLKK